MDALFVKLISDETTNSDEKLSEHAVSVIGSDAVSLGSKVKDFGEVDDIGYRKCSWEGGFKGNNESLEVYHRDTWDG